MTGAEAAVAQIERVRDIEFSVDLEAERAEKGAETFVRRRSYVACLREARRALEAAVAYLQEAEEHR